MTPVDQLIDDLARIMQGAGIASPREVLIAIAAWLNREAMELQVAGDSRLAGMTSAKQRTMMRFVVDSTVRWVNMTADEVRERV